MQWYLNIFVGDFSRPILWGGRSLTTDECMRELISIWKEFCAGRFDPKCEEKPLKCDGKTHLAVHCSPAPDSGVFSVGFFGFSTRRNPVFFFEEGHSSPISSSEADLIRGWIEVAAREHDWRYLEMKEVEAF